MPFNNKMFALMGRKGGGASSWNDLKDKPFYDSRVTGDIKITFDGKFEGREYIYFSDEEICVKVSDHVPTTEEFLSSRVVEKTDFSDGKVEHHEHTDLWEPDDFGGVYNWNGFIMFVPKDVSAEGITFTKGTWFVLSRNSDFSTYISELSYTGTAGELKKLDAKYLPDSIGRTYRFTGYSDGSNFVVESGDLSEFDEMLSNGLVDTGEVVNYTGDVKEVLRFVGTSFGDMGATYHFQKVWFDFDSGKVVGAEVGFGPSGNYYSQLNSGGGAPM